MKNSKEIKSQETPILKKAFTKALISFISITPMLIAVMGLVGLMQIYLTPDILSTFFGHGSLIDTLVGTLSRSDLHGTRDDQLCGS